MATNRFSPLGGLDPSLQIEEIAKSLQALKQGLLMASGPDPSTQSPKAPSFKDTLQKLPTRRQNVTSYWREKKTTPVAGITRGYLVRQRIASLRAQSSPQNPVYFRCTERGHLANECRNAQICFICHKLGHRAHQCRSVTLHPPSPVKKPDLVPPTKPHTKVTPPTALPSTLMAGKSMKAPIRTLYETEASEAQDQQFRRSFFLDDALGWGRHKIENALKKLVRHHNWLAARWDETRYLIEAPSPLWLEDTLNRGSVRLDNVVFKVSPWDPCYAEGLRMIPCWVRIRGFPSKFWQWEAFETIFSDFGATVLELDPGTFFRSKRRFARVRLGVCDLMLLPATHWVLHRDPGGYLSPFDLIIELEQELTNGTGAQSRKTVTADPHKAPPKPATTDPPKAPRKAKGVSINEPLSRNPAPAPTAVTGKGKGKTVSENDDTDFVDSIYEFDAQGCEIHHWTKSSRAAGSSQVPDIPPRLIPVSPDPIRTIPVGSHTADPVTPPASDEWATWVAADGTTLMEVQCGMVDGVTIEYLPHRQVLVHTSEGVVQCATKDIFTAMVDHLSAQGKIRPITDTSTLTDLAPTPPAPVSDSLTLSDTPGQTEEAPAPHRKGASSKKRTAAFGVIPRRSLRLVSLNSNESILAKAQKVAQAKSTLTAPASAGIPLVNNFPFLRLTDEEVEDLFQVYKISFGTSQISKPDLIRAIQNMSRVAFDDLIRQVFTHQKNSAQDQQVVLTQNELGEIDFQ